MTHRPPGIEIDPVNEAGAVLGIDEAGRGAQVGPLIVAGVVLTADGAKALGALGLRDSKQITAGRRDALVCAIRQHADWVGIEVRSAETVDRYVGRIGMKHPTTLNSLERRMAAALIRRAPPAAQVIADGAVLFARMRRRVPGLIAEDHADETRPAVIAAALVAKAERDRLLAEIDIRARSLCGSIPRKGYPGPATTDWLERYRSFFGELPRDVRRTWAGAALPGS